MLIGGLQKVSFIDYPNKLSCVIFTQGCPFRCHYCHNKELVLPSHFQKPMLEKEVFDFLEKKKNKLDGVVLSGGEPTAQPDLALFIKRIKEMGFLVKLDTSGINPTKLSFLIKSNLLDYIAMDIKAPFTKYNLLAGINVSVEKIQQTIRIIETSNIAYQFRTTFYKQNLNDHDIEKIRTQLSNMKNYTIQDCLSRN